MMLDLGDSVLMVHRTPISKCMLARNFDKKKYSIDKETKVNYQMLASKFNKLEFEWSRLQEIKQCLDAGMLQQALTLTLSIPDICGRIEYPDMQEDKNGTRYAKWFDENIDAYNVGESGKDGKHFDCFNGYMCYLLRCRMLHGEPKNIEDVPNRPQSALKKEGFDHIFFEFTDNDASEFFQFVGKRKIALFCKSIPQLVMQIISCADACYQKEPDKSKFDSACLFYHVTQMVDATDLFFNEKQENTNTRKCETENV